MDNHDILSMKPISIVAEGRFDGQPRPTKIPQIIHQAWSDENLPKRWAHCIASVRRFHPGWDYKLWTHDGSLAYVREHHPRLYPIFAGFNREMMRCDLMRYVAMHDIGGLYCDLDYEFIRPYNYADADLVLGYELELAMGDWKEALASCMFASAPGHPLWRDLIEYVIESKPVSKTERDILNLTGPGLLTKIFFENRHTYPPMTVQPRLVFSPYRMRGKHERQTLLNNGVTIGIHHAFGSWKQRWKLSHIKRKLGFGKRAA